MSYTIDDAKCTHSTDKAILVSAPDLDEQVWIPQSQIDDDSEVYKKGTEGKLVVSDWFAQKRGWISGDEVAE
jgi:hypothetical protein